MAKKDVPTPHIEAKYGDFAKTVLMPGDPLRAKYIAEHFLTDAKLVTSVRNMYGYTGKYRGKKISVMGSGMGMPSIGIYSYELYNFYDVNTIIRIGSAGAMNRKVKVMDIVLAQGACTNSNFQKNFGIDAGFAPIASWDALSLAAEKAKELKTKVVVGNVLSSDPFYADDPKANEKWIKMGVVCVEMEAAALYMNAARAGKNALAMFTISDELYSGKELTARERETLFEKMMELSLETGIALK